MKQTRAPKRRDGDAKIEGAQPAVVAPRVRRRNRGPSAPVSLDGKRGQSPFSAEPLALDVAAAVITERTDRHGLALDAVATKVRGRKRTRGLSLDEVAAKLREDEPAPACDHGPLDFALPARPIAMELIAGRGHYERVIAAVARAHTSVWIATANAKELLVEPALAGRRGRDYVSILGVLDGLAERGVELRLLHAELPSGPFREAISKHPRLLHALELRRCPRVHMKVVIVDGALLYLGSANWTGAGLGAKGTGRRNFELGFVTDDVELLDQVQAIYDRVWCGGECDGCKLREDCPGPLVELVVREVPQVAPRRRAMPARSSIRRRRVPRLI